MTIAVEREHTAPHLSFVYRGWWSHYRKANHSPTLKKQTENSTIKSNLSWYHAIRRASSCYDDDVEVKVLWRYFWGLIEQWYWAFFPANSPFLDCSFNFDNSFVRFLPTLLSLEDHILFLFSTHSKMKQKILLFFPHIDVLFVVFQRYFWCAQWWGECYQDVKSLKNNVDASLLISGRNRGTHF